MKPFLASFLALVPNSKEEKVVVDAETVRIKNCNGKTNQDPRTEKGWHIFLPNMV